MATLEELKLRAPIIPYIETYYPDKMPLVNKSQTGASCHCIFHQENNASMRLYPNGKFKCFGCGKHGDLIDIVMYLEQTDFRHACIKIGNNVGLPMSFNAIDPAWESYKDNMDIMCTRYYQNLMSNGQALYYLQNVRRLTLKTINDFGLGLVPNDEYTRRTDIGGISGRISIPLLDNMTSKPRCLGMSYRLINDNPNEPKYKNDRNQTGEEGQLPQLAGIFRKSEILYGYFQAKNEIKKSKFAFLTEGFFDVMSMYQSGLKNTVAIMGSELSDVQLRTLKITTNNVVVMMDGDNAGQKSTINIVKKLYKNSFNVYVVTLKDFNDPDEMCLSYNFIGSEIYKHIQRNMKNGISFIIDMFTSEYKEIIMREKIKVLNLIKPFINVMSDETQKALLIKEMYKIIDL